MVVAADWRSPSGSTLNELNSILSAVQFGVPETYRKGYFCHFGDCFDGPLLSRLISCATNL
jgi:hypothetical protein